MPELDHARGTGSCMAHRILPSPYPHLRTSISRSTRKRPPRSLGEGGQVNSHQDPPVAAGFQQDNQDLKDLAQLVNLTVRGSMNY